MRYAQFKSVCAHRWRGFHTSNGRTAGIPCRAGLNLSTYGGSSGECLGKSTDDIEQSFKMDGAALTYTPPKAGSSGNAHVYKVGCGTTCIREVQYSPGVVGATVK